VGCEDCDARDKIEPTEPKLEGGLEPIILDLIKDRSITILETMLNIST
jgi:hypothetical protein